MERFFPLGHRHRGQDGVHDEAPRSGGSGGLSGLDEPDGEGQALPPVSLSRRACRASSDASEPSGADSVTPAL